MWAAVWAGGPNLLGSLIAVDTVTGTAAPATVLPASNTPYLIAATASAVYVAGGGAVMRIDPATGKVIERQALGARLRALLAAQGRLWVTADGGRLVQLDPGTLSVVATRHVTGHPDAITTDAGAVLVTDDRDRTLTRMDIANGKVTGTTSIGANGAGRPSQITVYAGSIWVYEGTTVLRVATGALQLLDRVTVPGGGGSLAAGTGGVWVSGSFGVARIDPATGRARHAGRRRPGGRRDRDHRRCGVGGAAADGHAAAAGAVGSIYGIGGKRPARSRASHRRGCAFKPRHQRRVGHAAHLGAVADRVDEPRQRIHVGAVVPRCEVVSDVDRSAVAVVVGAEVAHVAGEDVVGKDAGAAPRHGPRAGLVDVEVVVHRERPPGRADQLDQRQGEAPDAVAPPRPVARQVGLAGVVGHALRPQHRVEPAKVALQAGRAAAADLAVGDGQAGVVHQLVELADLVPPVAPAPGADVAGVGLAEVAVVVRSDLVPLGVAEVDLPHQRAHRRRARAEADVGAAGRVAGRVVESAPGPVEQVDAGQEEAEAGAGAGADRAPVPPELRVTRAVERDHHELGRALIAPGGRRQRHRRGRRRAGGGRRARAGVTCLGPAARRRRHQQHRHRHTPHRPHTRAGRSRHLLGRVTAR